MKNSIGRLLLACTLIAVLGTGLSKTAMGKPQLPGSTSSTEITQVHPVTQAALLTDAELGRIVGGRTGCSWTDYYGWTCGSCCLNLWIVEICVSFCVPF